MLMSVENVIVIIMLLKHRKVDDSHNMCLVWQQLFVCAEIVKMREATMPIFNQPSRSRGVTFDPVNEEIAKSMTNKLLSKIVV